MANDILISLFRTLSSMGVVLRPGHFLTLRSAYLRDAQDAIRQYHADSIFNGLEYDRHAEEGAVEVFARQITQAGDLFQQDPDGGESLPNWTRVITALPDLPQQLRDAAQQDMQSLSESKQ